MKTLLVPQPVEIIGDNSTLNTITWVAIIIAVVIILTIIGTTIFIKIKNKKKKKD